MRLRATAGGFLLVMLAAVVFVRADAAVTLPYDQIRLIVPDPEQAVDWYMQHLGAQPRRPDDFADRVRFNHGGVLLSFTKGANAKPSAGSSIDHIGFSVTNVDAKMKELEAAGAAVVTPPRDIPGFFRVGFVELWGTKIEILNDPDLQGLHHIHLRVPDPDASMKWYVEVIGGERAKLKGPVSGVKYPELWLLADKGDGEPSTGHAIDHIGWRPPNMDATFAHLKAKNVKIIREPALSRGLPTMMMEDPYGVRVELIQR
jgi:catechol 2,3-dioxygenase-like lactoylglutathione lyase family enzyme